eukprot:CAMPEP_0174818072 /NCGR_PEP_ID=MMETSP1107-20130205/663_1 /TAXON_ID=36770 /ORGANISM="Paraphysomonas vestita, Strain GFlagA" /LENGTH=622 /DNA_ID=CAMNT_0016029415 /DNA_START=597 /DNA_END=2465 /DNA_ORIENTATION=+
MGNKISSKKVAKDAQCHTIPGFEGEVEDAATAVSHAKNIGYPVMIKASAGGGGKGMRIAYNDHDVIEGFKLCKAEALSAFGNDTMLIEKFIEDPHHIEIQVIADSFGNVAAFPERECSVQRRNQKVVEEAPSCLIDPETRRQMQDQAIRLCKAVGYRSAGTVEMLCDGNKNFYFLEMNTRLQVEHPITELVTGEDLVELMLRIAAGERLPQRFIESPHVPFNGHAIESRVYAEDPFRNFLPAIGPLNSYTEPPKLNQAGNVIRIDTGVFEGGVISMYYDPMIAKLCSRANDRETAIELMKAALARYRVQGLGNNMCFLQDIMRNKDFVQGNYGTGFIKEHYPNGFTGVQLNPRETAELIAGAACIHHATLDARKSVLVQQHENDGPPPRHDYVVILGGAHGTPYLVNMGTSEDGTGMHIYIKGTGDKVDFYNEVILSGLDYSPGQTIPRLFFQPSDVQFNDISNKYYIYGSAPWPHNASTCSDPTHHHNQEEEHEDPMLQSRVEVIQIENETPQSYVLRYQGSEQEVVVRTIDEHKLFHYMLPEEKKDYSNVLRSPMPGTLVSIDVAVGDVVEPGQQIAVVEAMKMQNILRAPKHTTIKHVHVRAGQNLKTDQVIIEYEKKE